MTYSNVHKDESTDTQRLVGWFPLSLKGKVVGREYRIKDTFAVFSVILATMAVSFIMAYFFDMTITLVREQSLLITEVYGGDQTSEDAVKRPAGLVCHARRSDRTGKP